MGYERHHAIIVTGVDTPAIEAAWQEARSLFEHYRPADWREGDETAFLCRVSDMVDSGLNGFDSFFIPPDGSKEGWQHSNDGDDARERFLVYLRQQAYENGSSELHWVCVQYGDDSLITKIVADSDEQLRARRNRQQATDDALSATEAEVVSAMVEADDAEPQAVVPLRTTGACYVHDWRHLRRDDWGREHFYCTTCLARETK